VITSEGVVITLRGDHNIQGVSRSVCGTNNLLSETMRFQCLSKLDSVRIVYLIEVDMQVPKDEHFATI
jgi:hypothetical protein